VFGREIQVKSTANAETVKEVEVFVNERISAVSASLKGGDSQVVAILAMMNIAEAYLGLVKSCESSRRVSDDKIEKLVRLIDELA
jgi:cell division protein ZapA